MFLQRYVRTGFKHNSRISLDILGHESIDSKDPNMHRMCQHTFPLMLNVDQSANEVKSTSQVELKDMAKNRFQKYFDDLYKPWKKRVVTQGFYFKGGCVSAV
ncbi:hypothetical protein TNCV_4814991 [Trichonephila clavipes]|nr:hypothetical protein TNCV_4814991 [Trichonephila clavipes]